HMRFSRDWSSDVCSSDLRRPRASRRDDGGCRMMQDLGRYEGLRETLPPIEYLPGGWMELRVAPALPRPVLHHEIRSLHGVITGLVGGHSDTDPRFTLFPHEGAMAEIGRAHV